MSRVLITGATGFIGRGALTPLMDSGFEVHAVSTRRPLPEDPPGVRWEHADLLDAAAAEAMIERIGPSPWNCASTGTYEVKIARKGD